MGISKNPGLHGADSCSRIARRCHSQSHGAAPRAPSRLIVKGFSPTGESIFWAHKWTLAAHVNKPEKPENPQLCTPYLKNQPHKQQKPCPFGTFLPSACLHAEADTMTEHSKSTQRNLHSRMSTVNCLPLTLTCHTLRNHCACPPSPTGQYFALNHCVHRPQV